MNWKNLNLPNKLTLVRIELLVPFLLIASLYIVLDRFHGDSYWFYQILSRILIASLLAIFIGAMITDYFDGYLARKNKMITSFGKLWDPIADKIITTAALIFLSVISKGFVSYIIVTLFVVRDLVVDGCRVVMKEHKVDVAASIWGKIKTFTLSLALIWLFILNIVWPSLDYTYLSVAGLSYNTTMWGIWWPINLPLLVALVFSLLSGYLYVRKTLKAIRVASEPVVINKTSKFSAKRTAKSQNSSDLEAKFKDSEQAEIVDTKNKDNYLQQK
ncbi:CDP-diacylglycerol--glycerol-3-phosphate 3-phosphatidyltransferase [Mycoplasma simbae]|uniref:CDP-diacylglycerol--glycerol-3-phosphate 3-phosphatidyltransferase n=1 Tax=Mycoplasma simbae TaxID=36744 RepID=UPI000A06AA82|nr:CDP-diacylglycerol--glycerol-3-phosphate 3-phosphatidyltransferase [Mycoplasma simbae]